MATEEYVQNRVNEILASSNSVNDDRVVDYIMEKGRYRAITADGNMGPKRDTMEEAKQATIDHFGLGIKVAETPEQQAELLNLARELKTYGSSGNTNNIAHIIMSATNSDYSVAGKVALSMSKGVGVTKSGQSYTSYGSGVDVRLNSKGTFDILSPEGVSITKAYLGPETIARFGLSAEKVAAALQQKVDRGFSLTGGAEEIMYESYVKGASGEQIDSFLRSQGSDPSQYNFAKTIARVSKETPEAISPDFSKEQFADKLNQAYNTPNNNISFGDGGLTYTYEDGTSVVFEGNLQNTDFFSNIYGIQTGRPSGADFFNEAQKFSTAADFNKYLEEITQRRTEDVTTSTQQQDTTTQAPGLQETPAEKAAREFREQQQQQQVETAPVIYDQQQLNQQLLAQNVPTGQVSPMQQATQTPVQTLGTRTSTQPLGTAGLSAIPQSISVATQPAGYTQDQLSQFMPGTQGQPAAGSQMVTYENDFGQQLSITEINGQPVTYVPPGYKKKTGAAKGGMMAKGYAKGGLENGDRELDAMYRMATRFLGYRGPKSRKAMQDFANSSPAAASKLQAYSAAMAKGGLMRKGYQEGGAVTEEEAQNMSGNLLRQTFQPQQANIAQIAPQPTDFIPTTAGQTSAVAPMAQVATVPTFERAVQPEQAQVAQVTPATMAPQVQQQTAALQAAQGQLTPQALVQAAQQEGTSVSDIQAAQGQAIMMDNPVQRQIQDGELISGAADAAKAAEFTEQIQAAEATPSKQATVAGQLETLMQQFEGGNVPAWAAGSMRQATQMLAARGLGASSLAGQAVIQATMEAALPIAQIDAQTQAQFESQNLSNRQQRAMLAAQQRAQFLGQEFDQAFQARVQNSARIGDIANMNFTAEQQVALENSRAANTVNLQNLSNRQAKVMAEAAALSQLDLANLNNRQQEAVQNAQNFLQMDMANLSNEQQTGLFKAQQNIQALFTDQAAQNAAAQFNASSENQTNQFFANLANQTAQFNASQRNAMDQFNVNSVNALRQFNAETQQQRDLFNAQNGLVIAQANAQWRQNIATLNTAAQNESNMNFAQTMNALTATNLDNIWQRERDIMSYAFTQSESAMDRALNILLADKELEAFREKMANDEETAKWAVGTKLLFG